MILCQILADHDEVVLRATSLGTLYNKGPPYQMNKYSYDERGTYTSSYTGTELCGLYLRAAAADFRAQLLEPFCKRVVKFGKAKGFRYAECNM